MLRIDRLLAREGVGGKPLFSQDRRLASRKEVSLSVGLQIVDRNDVVRIYNGKIINASTKGLLCGMSEPVPVSSRVTVLFFDLALLEDEPLTLPGDITRCLPASSQSDDWDKPSLPFEVAVVLDDSDAQSFPAWSEWLKNLA